MRWCGTAVQSTVTKGPWARGERSCIARATNPFAYDPNKAPSPTWPFKVTYSRLANHFRKLKGEPLGTGRTTPRNTGSTCSSRSRRGIRTTLLRIQTLGHLGGCVSQDLRLGLDLILVAAFHGLFQICDGLVDRLFLAGLELVLAEFLHRLAGRVDHGIGLVA